MTFKFSTLLRSAAAGCFGLFIGAQVVPAQPVCQCPPQGGLTAATEADQHDPFPAPLS